ncbi:MAG: 50S ribosome-binding GTPase [Candidatus Uhrbacteria bacterium]|nr:50S ribosome-binding GTPase [Candidatus Uhrbacteria bacterium]
MEKKQKAILIDLIHPKMLKRHAMERLCELEELVNTYGGIVIVKAWQKRFRSRQGLKTASIVGYTNAGKTTLLNALTGRKEYAADELFATLDTRVGQLYLPSSQSMMLVSDTIGFIKDLPPELLNAFSSTLSEAVDADLLIHVVDGSDPNWSKHVKVVEEILERLGVVTTPRIIVFNKSDQTPAEARGRIDRTHEEHPPLWISAATGQGLDALIAQIENSL